MKLRTIVLVVAAAAPLGGSAYAQTVENAFPSLSFTAATDLQAAADGSNRLFVAEMGGIIRVFQNESTTLTSKVYLDIADRVMSDDRFGLLGFAFPPDYADAGTVFVHYTAAFPNRSVISRFSVSGADPDAADPTSEVVLMAIGQPNKLHNGGQIAFGPDGMLYISMGDGGPGSDPGGHGQNQTTILGSMLRIDVEHPDAGRAYGIPADNPFVGNAEGIPEEMWAWGLRNTWRFSFDSVSGDLIGADNGEDAYEEINVIRAGENYGWKTVEGPACFSPTVGCNQTGLTAPIHSYGGDFARRSVIGGVVYRGRRNPELQGRYIYGDWSMGRIWSFDYDGSAPATVTQLAFNQTGLLTFGVDEGGELYFLRGSPTTLVYRFTPTAVGIAEEPSGPDLSVESVHPNPATGPVSARFGLDRAGPLTVAIYDLTGRRMVTLRDGWFLPGSHDVTWDGRDASGTLVPSSVYLVTIDGPGGRVTAKVTRSR